MSAAINWAKWKRTHVAPLWALLALAHGLDPDNSSLRPSNDQRRALQEMRDVALSNIGPFRSGSPLEAEGFDDYEDHDTRAWSTRLDVFGRWARSLGYTLPREFPGTDITVSGKVFKPSKYLQRLLDFEAVPGNRVERGEHGALRFIGIEAFAESERARGAPRSNTDTIRADLTKGFEERHKAEREGDPGVPDTTLETWIHA